MIELTNRRMANDGIVLSSYFDTECDGSQEVSIKHHAFYGKPRVVTVGIGANTEVGPLAKATWKTSRFTQSAHTLSADLFASFKQQSMNLQSKYYALRKMPRFYLDTSIENVHQSEDRYDQISSELRIAPAISSDNNLMRTEFSLGPSFTITKTQINFEDKTQTYPGLSARLTLTGHEFEYYNLNPEQGLMLNFAAKFINQNLGAPASAYQFSMNGHYLDNLGNYNPARLIWAWRWKMTMTAGPEDPENRKNIPIEFLNFLGGVQDIRGFERKSLPADPLGALTTSYVGTELRTFFIKEYLQPFVFVDAAMLGNAYLEFDEPLFWSPGFGMRYQSPIGAIRLSFARGEVAMKSPDMDPWPTHWQWYLSYGQEF